MNKRKHTYFIILCLLLLWFSAPSSILAAKDTTKPVISGATSKTIYIGSSFNTLSGITAKDKVDGNLTKKIKVSGTVNVKKAGKYKLTYTVSDKAKNKATVTRTITVKKDSTKPSITGASNKTINIGSSFNALSGITAKDNIDGTITKNIKVSGSVNNKKAGSYKLTYTVSDKAGNKTVVTRTITVKDHVKPILFGIKNSKINIGNSFNALTGITASDNNDGNLTSSIKVIGTVNTKKAGNYTLTYSVTDKAGNKISSKRTITVVDNILPSLSGIKDSKIDFGNSFDLLAGISASDNNDGDITSSIRVEGSVDINKAGSYILTYSVTDKSGNKASAKRNITVIDNINPEIIGATDGIVGLYTKFNLLDGVSASDNNDGDITSNIKISGSINPDIAGDYTIIYQVVDDAGNRTEIIRVLTVKKIAVSSLSINAPTSLKTDKKQQVTAQVFPSNATETNVIWSSSDETVAIIDENGVVTTLSEGTVTLTATADEISTSQSITVTDRPNLYLYKSGSATINGVIKSLSFNLFNYESAETVYIDKVEIYESGRIFTTYSQSSLQSNGINTTINPYSNFGMSITFKLGIWENNSKVVITARTSKNKSYQYTLDLNK